MDSPIWTKVGYNVDAIIKLINQGKLDLTQRNSQYFNDTVLHYWAGGAKLLKSAMAHDISYQEDSLRVVKLLVEKGADLLAVNSWGFTPLIEAANGPYRGPPNLKVLDFLLKREEYSREEKIEAMELVGAVILQNEKNALIFHKAFDYWRKALQLRQMEVEGSRCIEKPRLNLKKVQTIEWNTSAELEYVIEHPDKFVIQSFFVRLRILSSKNWGAVNFLISSDFLDHFFSKLQLKLDEIFDIIWAMLETLLSRTDLRENKAVQGKIGRVVEKLIEVLSCLKTDSSENRTKEIVKTSLDLITSANEFYELNLIRLVRNLSYLPQTLLKIDAIESLCKLREQRGENLLHEAIRVALPRDYNLFVTVRLLLNAGCDPNAIDKDGNAPLHYCLVQLDRRCWKDDLNTTALLLLDFGAQLSRQNADGNTPVDLLIRKNETNRNKNEDQRISGWKLPDWCTEFPTLTCLSARVIRRQRIPYVKLPASLIPIIEKHKITR